MSKSAFGCTSPQTALYTSNLRLALMTSLWTWSKGGILVAHQRLGTRRPAWPRWSPMRPFRSGREVRQRDHRGARLLTRLPLLLHQPAPDGRRMGTEATLYDGRCGHSSDDQKALAKAPEAERAAPGVGDRPQGPEQDPRRLPPKQLHDFVVKNPTGPSLRSRRGAERQRGRATHVCSQQ